MNCILKTSKEFKSLLKETNLHPFVLEVKIAKWQEINGVDNYPTVEDIYKSTDINQTLKAVDILQSDKAKQVFDKGKKVGWDLNKILTELQVPKEQKQLILDLGITDREQIALELASNYSYTVEINTAKDENAPEDYVEDQSEYYKNQIKYADKFYVTYEREGKFIVFSNDFDISRQSSWGSRDINSPKFNTKEEAEVYRKELVNNKIKSDTEELNKIKEFKPSLDNTQYYANLTVPGGTNYTENEISTPLITPSIKGHAQFSTDKGIGWFRSDESGYKTEEGKPTNINQIPENFNIGEAFYWKLDDNSWGVRPYDQNIGTDEYEITNEEALKKYNENVYLKAKPTKTRRILEVQSDLFQKGRDKKDLATKDYGLDPDFYRENFDTVEEMKEYEKTAMMNENKSPQNQFLQLLNKDNNWVTFFVKSIIQDSAKKGYEKVLFPSGNTASKVEGHTTLEEFKKQKEDRIKELESSKITKEIWTIEDFEGEEKHTFGSEQEANDWRNSQAFPDGWYKPYKDERQQKSIEQIDSEINQLKQELERVEGPEGFGALKPIYNFYENTVTNILKKQGLNPTVVTDEYGNTWNEIVVEPTRDLSTILMSKGLTPEQQFARKWNIGESGYSMNKLAPDPRMIKEAETLGLEVAVAKSGAYYLRRGNNRYNPFGSNLKAKTSDSSKAINAELNQFLINFLSTYGISVKFVNNLKSLGYDAVGIADITNKLIMISKGEESWDTLPEEAAHFIMELLGKDNPLYIRLMEIIDKTDIYAEVLAQYGQDAAYQNADGSVNTKKIKIEAIGKALTKNILTSGKESHKGFLATFRLLLDKIRALFGKMNAEVFAREVDRITLKISESVKDGSFVGSAENLKNSNLVLAQKPKVDKEVEKLKLSIKALEVRLQKAKRSNNPLESVSELTNTIDELNNLLNDRKAQAGLSMYTASVIKQLQSVLQTMNDFENSPDSAYLTNNQLVDISDFIETHEEVVSKLATLKYDSEFKTRNPETIKTIDSLNYSINEIKTFLKSIIEERTINIVEDLKHEKSNLDVGEALFNIAEEDNGWMNLWLGKASTSRDEVIRMVKNLMVKIKNRVERYTIVEGKKLLDAQLALEAKGFNDFGKFYERDSSGNKTGYLISAYNIGEFNRTKKEFFNKLRETLGIEDLDPLKMSTAQQTEYRKAIENFRDMYLDYYGQPNNKFKNPIFAKLNPDELKYYNALIERQKDNLSKLPMKYREDKNAIYKLPAVRKDVLHRLKTKEQGIFQNFKEVAKESVTIMEDDTHYGTKEIYTNPVTGKQYKFLPVHYTSMLDNPNNISDDLTGIYVAFTHMAEGFYQKSLNQDKVWMIQKAINERPYAGKKKAKEAAATNVAKMLENIIDADFYDMKIEKSKMSKITDAVINYVRRNNLVFNAFTHVANYVVGSVYSKIEDFAGVYTTNESKLWAEKTVDSESAKIMSDIGARKKMSKVSLLMEHNSVIKDSNRIFKNLDLKNKVGRIMFDSGLWSTYELADFRIKSKIMLSVYDNYRFYDGKFLNKRDFTLLNKGKTDAEISKSWSDLRDKSLWNYYDAVDGKLIIKKEVSENTQNMIKAIVNQVADQVDGKLSENDRPELYRHEIGRAILIHRGWLLQGAEARWKSAKLNYETGQFEEGYHLTFVKFLARATGLWSNSLGFNKNTYGDIIEYEKNLFTGAVKEAITNLTPEEKSNLAKAMADMMFIILAMIVAGILKGLGDDDENKDDWGIQFAAYMGQRFSLELGAFNSPMEVFQILSSPSAGLNQIESVFDLATKLTKFDDEGNWKFTKLSDRGAYKGYAAWEKLLIKRSILKPFYEIHSAEGIKEKRKYLENLIMN
jgi:hypothetical protein